LAAVIGTAALLRGRYLRWGATDEEQHRALAGDELLPAVDQSATRAITINAAAESIWPWIAQLGQGRGGFYSYDWLENLVVRADIHNANRIVPEWQHVAVGAEVRLAPEVRLQVADLEPSRALVLRGSVPMGKVAPPYEFTWAFVLLLCLGTHLSVVALIFAVRLSGAMTCNHRLGLCAAAATGRDDPTRGARTVRILTPVGRDDRPTGPTRQLLHEPANAARHQDPGRTHAATARAELSGPVRRPPLPQVQLGMVLDTRPTHLF